MRLKTARVVSNLYLAPNTLTQRTCGPMCNGWIKLDTTNMKDGDVCGLAAFQGESATLNVIKAAGKKVLLMRSEKSVMEEPGHKVKTVEYNIKETVDLKGDIVYLRTRLDYHWGENWAYMDYSLDGVKWLPIGDRVRMEFDLRRMFMGTKFAIFNYATKETGGWVDVDWFRLETLGHEVQGTGNVSPERSEPRKRSLEGWELVTYPPSEASRRRRCPSRGGNGVLKIEPFELGAVTLDGGPLKARRNVDIDYLLNTVKVDRLLAEFRNVAGLGEKAPRYPNRWEGGQINGHSLGHYLSAVSALYAVARGTGNGESIPRAKRVAEGDALAGVGADGIAKRAKEKVDYIVAELAACQKANGNGFLMTCPQEIYEKVKSGNFTVGGFDINRWWVPNYTLHKVFAGLRDAYRWAGNKEALEIERKLGDWYIGIVEGLSDENLQKLMISEWGGLNETFANLADDTGDTKYRDAAERYFDNRIIFDALKMRMDNLDGKHANTQIPKFAGLARLYEQTGKEEYRAAVETLWDSIVNKRSFANGGHSDDEHFYPVRENVKKLGAHNNETCNINNMLRLTAHTFGWNPTAAQMDFVERALYNQLAAQIGRKPGEFGYFLSQAPVAEKVWSTPEGAWWCCVGTGMENPMHYTDHVYYKSADDKTLYVNLFMPTTLDWKSKGVKVVQNTEFPYGEVSTLTVRTKKPVRFALKIRKPYWCKGIEVLLTGSTGLTGLSSGSNPVNLVNPVQNKVGKDGYFTIDREWRDGDVVEISLPMRMHASILPNSDGTRVAFMYGPLVLVGIVPPEEGKIDQATRRWDDHLAAPGKTLESAMTVVTTNLLNVLRTFKRVRSDKLGVGELGRKGLAFEVASSERMFGDGVSTQNSKLTTHNYKLIPLMDVYEEHYSVYFPVMTPRKWAKVAVKLAEEQKLNAAEAARIVDEVLPGFQQSEVNHDMRAEFSGTGEGYGTKWRNTIGCLGLLEYTLAVDGTCENELVITVCGDDGDQRYDIYIDGVKLCREEHSRLKPGHLVDQVYKLPRKMTDGKEKVRVSIRGFDDIVVDGVKKPNTGSGWIGGFFHFSMKRATGNGERGTGNG